MSAAAPPAGRTARAASPVSARAQRAGGPIERVRRPEAVDGRLFFAQVREDPRAELAALRPGADETIVTVSSGGCTALSLLAAGAARVVGVDLNATQHHLVELKAAAVTLGAREAIAFVGGLPSATRLERYRGALRGTLTAEAREYWDARRDAIARGVLSAGVSERFIAGIVAALRLLVHPRARIARMLAAPSVEAQRALFAREWSTRRWRWLFALLCSRLAFRGTYPAAFFAHVENPSFAAHFRGLAERTLTELPTPDNYFLHHMLTGRYPVGAPGGVPPYLSPGGAGAVAAGRERLTLVDGGMTEYLRTCPDRSVHGFALSNICEWMDAAGIDALFREVERTAAPGARLVYRNFVGWTELPAWCRRVVPDERLGAELTRQERSAVQRRVVACRVEDA